MGCMLDSGCQPELHSVITLCYYYSLNSYDDLVKKYRESQAQLKSDSRKVLRTKPTSQFFSVSFSVYLQRTRFSGNNFRRGGITDL